MGQAHLITLNECAVDITLHPLGLSGILAFMSSIPPTPVVIHGQRVILDRIILDIYLDDGERAAAIMFNEDGSCVETTANWRARESSRLASRVRHRGACA
jgi:hypothetical protein